MFATNPHTAVKSGAAAREGELTAGVVAAGGAADPWAGRGLRVPEERNNHFFVRGMGEFLFAHLEGADEEPSLGVDND